MMKYGLIVVQYVLSFYLFIFSCCAWMEFLHLCFYVTGCFCVFVSSSLCMFKCTMLCFNYYGKLHEIHMSCCVLSFPYSCVRCCAWGTIETIWKFKIPLSQLEFLEPQLETSCTTFHLSSGGKWEGPRGCVKWRGISFLGFCRLMGVRVCWLELLWELTKYEEYGNWSQRKVV